MHPMRHIRNASALSMPTSQAEQNSRLRNRGLPMKAAVSHPHRMLQVLPRLGRRAQATPVQTRPRRGVSLLRLIY